MKPVVPPFARHGGFGTLGSSFEEPKLPAPVTWTPGTVGAWLTLSLVFLALLALLGRTLLRYRRRAPRRAALRELGRLEPVLRDASERGAALERLAILIKSVALASFGRARVAALSGQRWRAFLVETAPNAGFEGPAGETLLLLGERGAGSVDEARTRALLAASRSWIRRHRG